MKRNDVLGKILCGGLVPIVISDALPVLPCVETILEAGFESIEISCRHNQSLSVIRELKKQFPNLAVGAASLIEDGRYLKSLVATRNIPTINEAVEAGADFLVSLLPFHKETYAAYAKTHVMIPGVATPGEAHRAIDWGANLVKFANPGLHGGPALFRGMDAATHQGFPFFTTGGITTQVISDYVAARVLVFGAGMDIILGQDYEAMQKNFNAAILHKALTAYRDTIRSARDRHMPEIPFSSMDPAAIARASGRCLNQA